MVGPGALKPKVGDGIKSRRPFSAPVLHSFILLFFFFVLCLLLHLYWCVYNNNNNNNSARTLRMRTASDYPGFDYTTIIAYRSVCNCCTAGFLLSVSGRRVEASLRYTVSLVGICLNV